MSEAEQGKRLIQTAINWTCLSCPKKSRCPANTGCFNTFMANLKKLLKDAHKHD